MLVRHLHPLDRRQQTLLLTLMSFAGSGAGELMELLPDDVAQALRSKQSKLEEIPKEKRLPLMVRELKQLMSFRAMKGIEGVEPSWLSAGFKGESPRVIGIVLLHMPSSISRQIVQRLPENVREALPSREELRTVPIEVVKLVRARFDAKFAAMPQERELSELRFKDVVLASASELITLVRQLGLDELACAFLAVGKRALAELLRRLSVEDGEELVAAVKRADIRDQMDQKAAQAFLGKVLGNFANPDELFQKAGLWRLSRALVAEDRDTIRQLSQRFPRAHGRLLGEYLEKVRESVVLDESKIVRLRDQVLDVLVDLSRRGKIDGRFAQTVAQYEGR